jgi:hypothetical protein
MAISGNITINVGNPNDPKNSDSLYTAFNKINTNFDTIFGNASNVVAGNGITVTNNTNNTVVSTNLIAGNNISLTDSNGAVSVGFAWANTPATRTSPGTAGQISYDGGGNLFICVATNIWAKVNGTINW